MQTSTMMQKLSHICKCRLIQNVAILWR